MINKILIIDDDPAIVDAMQMVLTMEGYVCESMTEFDSIKAIEQRAPDIILLDLWMSSVDGRAVCRTIKSNNNTRDINVIIVSADRDIYKHAAHAGADDYLEKPFDIHTLLDKVRKFE